MKKKTTPQPEPEQRELSSVLEYLRSAPPALLEAFELSRLNHIANMREELSSILERMAHEMAEARLARLLLEHRRDLLQQSKGNGAVSLDSLSEIISQAKLLAERSKVEP